MKPVFTLFCILLFTFFSGKVIGQSWHSAKFIAGWNGGSWSTAVATDRAGNVFTSAYYEAPGVYLDTAYFFGEYNIPYMIVAKYDSVGNVQWGTSAGVGYIMGMECDKSGNVIVLGHCYAPFSWQGYSINDTPYSQRYFVAKISAAGSILWMKSIAPIGSSGPPVFGAVAIDENENIYVTGGLVDSVNSIEGHLLIGNGGADIFINKYDRTGNLSWTKSMGGNGDDLSWAIAATPVGNIYITGSFSSDSLDFGSTRLIKRGSGQGGLGSVYIAKFDSSGLPLWAKSSNGLGVATGVATDVAENAYITGMSTHIAFDSFTCVHAGSEIAMDMTFTTKFSSIGNVEWAKKIDYTGPTIFNEIEVDACNNIWISIDRSGVLTVAQDFPAKLIEYAPDGTVLEDATIQSAYGDRHLAIGPQRNIYLASSVHLYVPFGWGTRTFHVGSSSHVFSNHVGDAYVAKYVPAFMARDSAYTHSDTSLCSSTPMALVAPIGYGAYRWSDGAWGSERPVTDATPYWVYCYPPSCSMPVLIDTFSVTVDSITSFSLGGDTASCEPFYLIAPHTSGSFSWQDSSTVDSYYVTTSGTYILTETDGACTFADTINVIIDSTPCSSSRPMMPIAFTPNNDGVNDIIRPILIGATNVSEYSFTVYSRYGQRVFTSNDPAVGWDGSVNSRKAEMDVYMYDVRYRAPNGTYQYKRGNITLVR